MKIDPSFTSPVVPATQVEELTRAASPDAADPQPDATPEFSERGFDNDVRALSVKAKLGSANPGVLMSSSTGPKPPTAAPPAPVGARDLQAVVQEFQESAVPQMLRRFDGAMERAAILVNGDITPGQYAASMGNPKKLLAQLKNLEAKGQQLLEAGRQLHGDVLSASAGGRGVAINEQVAQSLQNLEKGLKDLSATRSALEQIVGGGGGEGGISGLGTAARSAAKGVKPGIKGAETLADGATEALGKNVTKAMGEGATEAFSEAAVRGLAGGSRAFLSALGEVGLPVLDALIVAYSALSAMQEGKDNVKRNNLAQGFGAGTASALLGETPDWVRDKLGFHSSAPGITDRVLGAEGLAEKSFNEGLAAGYKFARGLTPEQKSELREAAFKGLAAQGYKVDEKDFLSEENVRKVGAALVPVLQQLVQQAQEAEEQKAAARRAQYYHAGHNI